MTDFAKILRSATSNGLLIAGISTGTEKSLDDINKYPIISTDMNINEVFEWGIKFLPIEDSIECDKMKLAGLIIVHEYGIATDSSRDKRDVNTFSAVNRSIVHEYDIDFLNKMFTIMVATKINYFSTNHHIGQGSAAPLIKKVYNAVFNRGSAVEPPKGIMNVLHTVSHWMDTKYILSALGIPNLAVTIDVTKAKAILLADDFELRKSVMPSGTAAVALCYAAIKRLSAHPLRALFPRIREIPTIIKLYDEIQADRARYHVASSYLTGLPRKKYDNTVPEGMIGPIGSFIVNLYPNSSIANSPKFRRGVKMAYKEAEYYDDGFDAVCAKWKKQSMNYTQVDLAVLGYTGSYDALEGLAKFDEMMSSVTISD